MNSSCRAAIFTKLCRFSGPDKPTQTTRHRTIENANKRPVFPSLFLMTMISVKLSHVKNGIGKVKVCYFIACGKFFMERLAYS